MHDSLELDEPSAGSACAVARPRVRSRVAVPRPLGPDRRVVLYTSSECWRGASVSYVNIARGLVRHGHLVRVVALDALVGREFSRQGLDVTVLSRARGESWRLRRFLGAYGADVLMVDRAHDLRVGTLPRPVRRCA